MEDEPVPKARSGSSSRAATGDDTRSSSPDGSEESEEQPARPRPQPRYDSASFDKWVANNPEAAAELAAKRFKTQLGGNAEAWKSQFVALEQKRRRHHEAFEQEQSTLTESKAEIERLRDEALAEVQPHIDAAEALSNESIEDFEKAFAAAFGKSFDDVARWRLRARSTSGGVQPVHLAKITEQDRKIAELEAKLAEKGKPAPAKSTEVKAPKVSASFIEREIAEDHGVRDLADWQAKVEEAYQDSYDEESEDFGVTVEQAADEVFEAFLAKRAKARTPEPERRTRTASRRPVARREPEPEPDDDDDEPPARGAPADWNARVANALRKAEKRAAR